MTPTPPRNADLSETERQLAIFTAHAMSQPLRLMGQSEASLSMYAVFWSVAAREGRSQVEVAEKTGLSTKTVSRVIWRLGMSDSGMGLIRQISDEGDRRRKRLILSSKGKTLLERMLRDLKNVTV